MTILQFTSRSKMNIAIMISRVLVKIDFIDFSNHNLKVCTELNRSIAKAWTWMNRIKINN